MEPCHSLKSFEVEFILTKQGARSVVHEQLLVRMTSCCMKAMK